MAKYGQIEPTKTKKQPNGRKASENKNSLFNKTQPSPKKLKIPQIIKKMKQRKKAQVPNFFHI